MANIFKKDDYNRYCAEFLGWHKLSGGKTFSPPHEFGGLRDVEDLLFDVDWNWIHPVIDKIQEILIKHNQEFIIEWYEGMPGEKITYVSCGELETKNKDPKKAVVYAIWKFLNHHKFLGLYRDETT